MNRALALLLIPCLLLTQSIPALGHSHGSDQPAGHGLSPHFHVTRSSSLADETHHHHSADGHHHHHGDSASLAADSQTDPQPEPLSQDEHDSDAVYIAQLDWCLTRTADLDESVADSCAWGVPVSRQTAVASLDMSLGMRSWWQAPPRRSTCPRYISLRMLRI